MSTHAGAMSPSCPIPSHRFPSHPVRPYKGGTDRTTPEGTEHDPRRSLFAVLDGLAAEGVSVSLTDGVVPAIELEPRPSPALLAGVLAHRVWLGVVIRGRRQGFAPATCDACGFVSMVAVVTSSGTSRWAPSVGWPRCVLTGCRGRRVIREADRVGVARVKYRAPRRREDEALQPPRTVHDPEARRLPK